MPAHRKPLESGDGAVEQDSEDAGDDDRRPRLREREDAGLPPDLDSQRVLRASEVVAHFNPVKMNGSAFGIRTRLKISGSPPA